MQSNWILYFRINGRISKRSRILKIIQLKIIEWACFFKEGASVRLWLSGISKGINRVFKEGEWNTETRNGKETTW